jgi:AcrR family transcriptional regulator
MATSDGDNTRERILAIALDRFIDKGYEATSLREIAEEMGFSKAALYYHFASKSDILMALYLRLHEITTTPLDDLGPGPVTPEDWQRFLEQVIDEMLAHRKLFVLLERNRAAIAELQQHAPSDAPSELLERLRAVWTDQNIDPHTRFRMAASFTAALSSALLVGDVFDQLSHEEASSMIRDVIHDILAPLRTPTAGR